MLNNLSVVTNCTKHDNDNDNDNSGSGSDSSISNSSSGSNMNTEIALYNYAGLESTKVFRSKFRTFRFDNNNNNNDHCILKDYSIKLEQRYKKQEPEQEQEQEKEQQEKNNNGTARTNNSFYGLGSAVWDGSFILSELLQRKKDINPLTKYIESVQQQQQQPQSHNNHNLCDHSDDDNEGKINKDIHNNKRHSKILTTPSILEYSSILYNKRICDVGTGLGLTSITASLLGARQVIATDGDENLLKTLTIQNLKANIINITSDPTFIFHKDPSNAAFFEKDEEEAQRSSRTNSSNANICNITTINNNNNEDDTTTAINNSKSGSNCRIHNKKKRTVQTSRLLWGNQTEAELLSPPFDIILASDVVFERTEEKSEIGLQSGYHSKSCLYDLVQTFVHLTTTTTTNTSKTKSSSTDNKRDDNVDYHTNNENETTNVSKTGTHKPLIIFFYKQRYRIREKKFFKLMKESGFKLLGKVMAKDLHQDFATNNDNGVYIYTTGTTTK